MPKRNRRHYLALGGLATLTLALLAFALLSLSQYERGHRQENETASTYQAQGARGEIQATCVQQPRSRTYTCTAEVPAPDQHDPYAEHDLRAQQDMARWAYAVVHISFGTLLLTGVGVLLLWGTLESTNATLKEAERTTKQSAIAAHAAVRQADIAESADRAWVFVEPVKWGFLVPDPPHQKIRYAVTNGVQFTLSNHGRTNAVIREVMAELYWVRGWTSDWRKDPDPGNRETHKFRTFSGPHSLHIMRPATFIGADGVSTEEVMPRGSLRIFREPAEERFRDTSAPPVMLTPSTPLLIEAWFIFNLDEPFTEPMATTSMFFHCVVRYEDIRGNLRETSYFRRAVGAGEGLTVSPKELDAKYNYRK